jgi:hypothetical protein
MHTDIDGRTITRTFDSLSEYADNAELTTHQYPLETYGYKWAYGEDNHCNRSDAFELARVGWMAKQDAALELVEDAITEVESDLDVTAWSPVWDVQGGAVDVGQYLAGEPECMIEYPPTVVPRTGRVVTIVSSIMLSSAVRPETVIKRGTMIAALAMILERKGYNTEIWADLSCHGERYTMHDRILVKGANDVVDPSRILYALANPSMPRVIGFSGMYSLPPEFKRDIVSVGHGYPSKPVHNLPEGTIYVKELLTWHDYDATAELVSYLRSLGIIE